MNRFSAALSARLFSATLFALALLPGFAAAQDHARQDDTRSASPSSQTRTAAITGRVVTNEGDALGHAAIRVQPVGRSAGARTTSADANGRFNVPDLDPGAYVVTAHAPGYVRTRDITSSNEEPVYSRPGDSLQLTLRRGGVITGKVATADGAPVVGITIFAQRIRDEEDRPARQTFWLLPRRTDDRGIYRLYGLEPGTYVVHAGGASSYSFTPVNAYGDLAPVYHPAGTRDTAAEIVVRSGGEITGVDIRYRSEQGRTISGKLAGATESTGAFSGISIVLTHAGSDSPTATTFVSPNEGSRTFSLSGIADGDYILTARHGFGDQAGAASQPRPITVRGADIAGIELALAPLASLSGTLRIQPVAVGATNGNGSCRPQDNTTTSPEEIVLVARRQNDKPDPARSSDQRISVATPTQDGSFRLRNLDAARYRLEARLPGDDLYINSITRTHARATATPQSAPKSSTPANDFDLTADADMTGVQITLAHGAALIAGRVAAAENTSLPAGLRVYLVPVAVSDSERPWRYHEATTANDGAWRIANVAPGSYRFLVLPSEYDERGTLRLLTADAAQRVRLRRLAEANGAQIELISCERRTDFALQYAPPK